MPPFPPITPPRTTAKTLPPELWLEIIPHIPPTPSNLLALRLTNTHLHALLRTHEHTLVKEILTAHAHLSHATRIFFPSLKVNTYKTLHTLQTRLALLATLETHWPALTHPPNTAEALAWLTPRWTHLHSTGLTLLYNLRDTAPTHSSKIRLLTSLPATSLALLLYTCVASVKILRVLGRAPMRARSRGQAVPTSARSRGLGDVEVRSQVELAFEEMLLAHGAEFFGGMLDVGGKQARRFGGSGGEEVEAGAEWAVTTLTKEISTTTPRQYPHANGTPKPATLISTLRRALAEATGVHVSMVVSKTWEILSGTGFDEVDDVMVGKLVRGVGVGGGG
ncbi:hypothetical protein LTR08_005061 [Meristemomyces frigidus]|nr:hypothetical protein LTR08_005061 [Meristemomyces frigidus]